MTDDETLNAGRHPFPNSLRVSGALSVNRSSGRLGSLLPAPLLPDAHRLLTVRVTAARARSVNIDWNSGSALGNDGWGAMASAKTCVMPAVSGGALVAVGDTMAVARDTVAMTLAMAVAGETVATAGTTVVRGS